MLAVGPSPRYFDSRRLVRHACSCARNSLEAAAHSPALSASALQQVIKPVPAVFADRLPSGGEWEDCLEPELRRELPGDLAVADFVEARGEHS